jgi:hypothetical protein
MGNRVNKVVSESDLRTNATPAPSGSARQQQNLPVVFAVEEQQQAEDAARRGQRVVHHLGRQKGCECEAGPNSDR